MDAELIFWVNIGTTYFFATTLPCREKSNTIWMLSSYFDWLFGPISKHLQYLPLSLTSACLSFVYEPLLVTYSVLLNWYHQIVWSIIWKSIYTTLVPHLPLRGFVILVILECLNNSDMADAIVPRWVLCCQGTIWCKMMQDYQHQCGTADCHNLIK